MSVKIQLRRGTAAEWASANPTLSAGEAGFETDTGKFKIGNGSTTWTSLAYATDTPSEITGLIDTHIADTTSVHGIADTSALETQTGAQFKANAAETAANEYTDTAIASLVDTAPTTLNTLNELAAALGDDANFATTITTSIATKATLTIDTAANWTSANAVLASNTFGLESNTGKFKIGNGVATWVGLQYAGTTSAEFATGLADTLADAKDYSDSTDLAHANLTTDVHGIPDTSLLITGGEVETLISNAITPKAPIADPTFTGTVVLPSTTSIGDVSDLEIMYLNGTTSNIQSQIGERLESSVAATTYAPLANANFTGTVVLPSTTSIGDVSNTEISYLNGVTSTIQTQIDSKASSSDLSTHVSGTTSVHGIADTSTLETQTGAQIKADAAESAANTYTDTQINALTTTAIEEGTLLYFTDERAQDAVGLNVGDGLSYDDASGAISASAGTGIQFNVSGAIEIDGNVTTNAGIQTLTNKTISTASNDITVVAADISDVTASAAELNTLDGITASTAELNYVDGVTSAIQTQLDGKADLTGDTFTGNVIISSNTASSSTTTGALVITGGLGTGDSAYIGGDLIISGDFTVNGTTTTVSTTDLEVTDPLIYIGTGNEANSVDIGVVGHFDNGTYQHTGIVRDASDDKWKLFKGVTDEPTTTVNFGQGSLDALAVGAFEASSATIGDVSNTELQYLNGVTSAVQTQLNAKLATATAATTYAPIADPTFTGTVTVAASGVAFTDGTQTKAGVPSITVISQKTASYTLSSLTERDTLIEISSSSGTTLTIPADATVNYPVGTTLDILQTSTGQVTIAGAVGVTVNATPGLKLRTQWSSATLMKRAANTWIVYGDLMA